MILCKNHHHHHHHHHHKFWVACIHFFSSVCWLFRSCSFFWYPIFAAEKKKETFETYNLDRSFAEGLCWVNMLAFGFHVGFFTGIGICFPDFFGLKIRWHVQNIWVMMDTWSLDTSDTIAMNSLRFSSHSLWTIPNFLPKWDWNILTPHFMYSINLKPWNDIHCICPNLWLSTKKLFHSHLGSIFGGGRQPTNWLKHGPMSDWPNGPRGLYVHKHGLTTYRGQWVQDHHGWTVVVGEQCWEMDKIWRNFPEGKGKTCRL